MVTTEQPDEPGDKERTEGRTTRPVVFVERDTLSRVLDQALGLSRYLEQLDIGRKLLTAMQPSIRALDRITPQPLVIPELYAARTAFQLMGGHSAILAAREALIAQTRINETLQALARTPVGTLERIGEMLGTADSVARLADAVSRVRIPIREIELAHSATMQAWRRLSEVPPLRVEAVLPRLEVGIWVAQEATLSVAEIIPEFEEPAPKWEVGPRDLRNRLLGRLRELDPNLPSKLEGAWERIETPGPDALGQSASSLAELIDWALRLAAQDADVLGWHQAENRPPNELEQGRPTRGLRVRYILRGRDLDGDVAETFISSLLAIHREIQGHKHKLGERALGSLKHLIPAIEATLIFILLDLEP